MKLKLKLLVIAFLLTALGSVADNAPDVGPIEVINRGLDPQLAAEIQDYVVKTMDEKHSPGMAIGIVRGDSLVYQGYFGWAKINDTPVSKTTVFRIGSISKTFTAMGLMQQWEQGKFTLDTEFNSVMPYPVIIPQDQSCGPVTFRHMFTHTSGGGELMSYHQLLEPTKTMAMGPHQERPELEDAYRSGIHPGVCAGEKWCYCNFCYGALGFALEELSGMSFRDYTEQKVFEPIGMEQATFYENDEVLAHLAQGYSWSPLTKRFKETAYWHMPIVPMGNVFSTVPEMGEYLKVLLNHGANRHGRLVKPETLEFMYETKYTRDERLAAMGVTFVKYSTLLGTRVLGHNGAVPGFGSSMVLAPDRGVGVIVFGNVMSAPPYETGNWLILKLIGYEKQREFPEPDRSKWPELEGWYGSEDPDFLSDFRFVMSSLGAFKVEIKKDQLVLTTLRPGKRVTLRQVSAHDPYLFMIDHPESAMPGHLVFVPGPAGQARTLRAGLNDYGRLQGSALAKVLFKAALLGAVMPASF